MPFRWILTAACCLGCFSAHAQDDYISPVDSSEMKSKGEKARPEKDKLISYNQRHFLTHNAFTAGKKSKSFRTSMFALYQFDYSLLDQVSLRAGAIGFLPSFGLKTGIRITDNLHAGFNSDVLFIPSDNTEFMAGYGHAMLTYGDVRNNLSAGGMFFFTNEIFIDYPVLTLGANIHLGRNFYLVSDNFLLPADFLGIGGGYYSWTREYWGVYSIGVRINTSYSSYDAGVFIIPLLYEVIPIPIPIISYSIRF